METKDYVLGKFSKNDQEIIKFILSFSNDILNDFITKRFDAVMSKYNGVEYEFK